MRTALAFAGSLLLIGAARAEVPRVPLIEGTVYTYVAALPKGDEEHIVTLTRLDDQQASFSVEFRTAGTGQQKPISQTHIRRVRRQDLLSGNRVNLVFQDGDPELFPGSSFLHLSAATLDTLKRSGETPLVLGTLKGYQGLGDDNSIFAMVSAGRKYFRGTIKRVGTGTVAIPVLVNGVRQLLPAIEARGRLSVAGDSIETHGWWLDDAQNPLSLKSEHSQLVRIDFPAPAPEKHLAESLSQGDCRAALPGIYFDTASASLLPQSGAALATVAKLLKAQPAWTLTVEGHTDNVGAAAYNLDLSRRRAAAVQSALQSQYGIGAQQLRAEGFGASRPMQDNTTLEGRAANRRVELVRRCRGSPT